jgi:dihydropteroate synthase
VDPVHAIAGTRDGRATDSPPSRADRRALSRAAPARTERACDDAGVNRGFRIMGVVNVTPDSFSDGGLFLDADAAVAHARALEAEGADILDVGGESTRPGAEPVAFEEELRRVIPVIEALVAGGARAQISIDTMKLPVAEAAVAAGATYVNDVTAFRADPQMAALVADREVECCLMHMRGEPRTMQRDPVYDDVVSDVKAFLEERLAFAVAEGIAEERIQLDPGIGFGKTMEHNLELLRRLGELVALGRPLVIGTSRKSFLGRLTGREVDDRLAATIATNVLALERGASVFRVHDVGPVRDALTVAAATVRRT